jgi:hypothetical protein
MSLLKRYIKFVQRFEDSKSFLGQFFYGFLKGLYILMVFSPLGIAILAGFGLLALAFNGHYIIAGILLPFYIASFMGVIHAFENWGRR